MRRKRSTTVVVSCALIAAFAASSGTAAHGAPSAPSSAAAPAAEDGRTYGITLVTGDRITVTGDGRVRGVEHGEGRDGIPISVRRGEGGHTYVVPADAEALLGSGRLDRRLFDATELARPEYRGRLSDGLPLIVSYRGKRESEARANLRTAGTTDRRELPALDGQAFTVETGKKGAPAKVWKALTDESSAGARTLTTAAGVDRVWLDGVRRSSLAESVPQIGAPTAWQAGFTGKGVKVAVLDTGVDDTHPDLADAQTAEKNFTEDPDATDGNGHGTHVASTITGTGAKSGGKYKGVAPDAEILDGKVLDSNGGGMDSWIIAGMEWAAEQHADVVNMSLGGDDTPGLDPLEATVERLSAQPDGPLFVIAAGNFGPSAGSLGSPGTSPSALTVGAVDKQDGIAEFSSRGPGNGDYGLKPDVTAPGVDITAARAAGTALGDPKDDWYTTLSGTSMATPHVAGAAALLVQEHPDWSGQRVKQTLVSSATGRSDASAFAQGTGRVDLGRAIGQTVVAETSSLSFGLRQWPHQDDAPATQRIVYRNTGAQPVTLNLSVETTGPDGKPGPAGMFTLDADTVTVPAGGTASVGLTGDTRPGGDVNGAYSAYVTASGGGQNVRTSAAVLREDEAYDVKVEHTGRDGLDFWQYSTTLFGLDVPAVYAAEGDSGGTTATFRLPKGRYLLDSRIYAYREDDPETWDADWIVEPVLTVDGGTTTVTADARTAEPVDVTVPDAGARQQDSSIEYMIPVDENVNLSNAMFASDLGQLSTAHLGADAPGFKTQLTGLWSNPSSSDVYAVGLAKSGRMFDGVTHHATKSELATLDITSGASVPGREGRIQLGQRQLFEPLLLASDRVSLPYTRRVHLSGGDVPWYLFVDQLNPAADREYSMEGDFITPPTTYKTGRIHPLTFNTGVYGPVLTDRDAVARSGDVIYGSPAMFGDGAGHAGSLLYDTVRTELYRDGELLAAADEPLKFLETEVPAQDAEYRLTTAETHGTGTTVSTRVEAAWTFRSAHTDGERVLPLSVVRFTPKLALDSTARAGASLTVPVTVQGAAAGERPKSLTVEVSTDRGTTWKKAPLVNGTHVVVKNPAAGGSVSFRSKLTDKAGNTAEQTLIDAYRTK